MNRRRFSLIMDGSLDNCSVLGLFRGYCWNEWKFWSLMKLKVFIYNGLMILHYAFCINGCGVLIEKLW